MINYGKQWIDDDDINAVVETLKSDFLTQGPKVKKFEDAICEYTGANYCVAVSSGTAAIHIAVASLQIEKSREGITSPNTFMASSNCMIYNGIKPVFADIDNETYCIDPERIKGKITENTHLIIPVHFAGQPCDMDKIKKIAKQNGLFIIEDATHAIGSKYDDGSRVGNCKYSDLTIFSFHPVKTITSGEGGAITTNNKELYKRLLLLRNHGITKKNSESIGPWHHGMQILGYNYRLSDLHASLGISQLKKLDKFVKRRREIVEKYNEAFKNIDWITTPYERPEVYSAFHLHVLKIDFDKIGKSRKQVMEELRERNIGTQVHYIPVHTQPYYQNKFGYKWGDYPISEKYYQKALSIPLYPKMSDEDVRYVISMIIKTFEEIV
ncbi:UDP-4-amino-4,6-dideoxy-N-acetyl-beta-L-altrosamine transaminase [bacterium]|nr:UDP-4-amino-4,6-dideoxy-N-acetyl-beta-L-altrosamine transaminase [bacterium]